MYSGNYQERQGSVINGKYTPNRGSDAHKLAQNVLGAEYRTWGAWGLTGTALLSGSVAFCCSGLGVLGGIEAVTNLQDKLAVGVGGSLALVEGLAVASTVALALSARKMFKERKALRAEAFRLAKQLKPDYRRGVRSSLRPNLAVTYGDANPLPAMELTRRDHSRASTATTAGHWLLRGIFALGVGGIADVATSIISVNPLLGQVVGVGGTLMTGFFMASRFGTAGEAAAQLSRTRRVERQRRRH